MSGLHVSGHQRDPGQDESVTIRLVRPESEAAREEDEADEGNG